MKINPDLKIVSDTKNHENKRKVDSGGKSFDAVLKEAAATKSSATSQTRNLMPGLGIGSVQFDQPKFEKVNIADQMDRFVNLLEAYKTKLEDPNLSLREIEPVVRQLDSEKQKLENIFNALDENDSIKPIINHALIDSTLEISKFNGGYYIDD